MLTQRRRTRERGQVLILALGFIAAFALVVQAVLALSSATGLQHLHSEKTAQTDAAGEGGAAFAAADAARNPTLNWCLTGQSTPPGSDSGSLKMADGTSTQAHYNLVKCDPGQTASTIATQGHCLLCVLNQTGYPGTPKYMPTTGVFGASCAQGSGYCLTTVGGDDYINGSISGTANKQQLQACSDSTSCGAASLATIALLDAGLAGGATSPANCCSPTPSGTNFTTPVTDPLATIGDPSAAVPVPTPVTTSCPSWTKCEPTNCLPAAAAPTVAPTPANGNKSFSYAIVAFNGNGDMPESANGSTSKGPATLNAANYNMVSWGAIGNGATGVKVIRTVGGTAQGIIATINSAAAGSLKDTGLTAATYVAAAAGTWVATQGCSFSTSSAQDLALYEGVWNSISVTAKANVLLNPGLFILTGNLSTNANGIVCAPGTIAGGVCTPSAAPGVSLYLTCVGGTVGGQQVAYQSCPSSGAQGGAIAISGGNLTLTSTPCPAGQQVPLCPGYEGVGILSDPHLVDPDTKSCDGGSPGGCAVRLSGGGSAINGSVDTRSAGIAIVGGGNSVSAGFLITNALNIQVNGSSGTGMALTGPGSFTKVGNPCNVLVLNVYTGPAPAQQPLAVLQSQCGASTTKQSGIISFNYIP